MVTSESLGTDRSGLLAQWSEDVECVFDRDPAARSRLEILLTYPGVHAVLMHRFAHRLWRLDWKLLARWVSFVTRWLTNVDIHPGATIGRRLFIDHGAGVVIGETTEIGDDVTLYHGVTLGGTSWNKEKRHPTLGDGVLVGAGAKILGPVRIGDRVRVGANSVVNTHVPACSTVVGIPGRIVRRIGVQIKAAHGIDLNHHLIPDPVGKALGCVMERLDKLEQNTAAESNGENCPRCEAHLLCDEAGAPRGRRERRH
jgi:serine O-acetyltransferase